jgi:hypothetical protein
MPINLSECKSMPMDTKTAIAEAVAALKPGQGLTSKELADRFSVAENTILRLARKLPNVLRWYMVDSRRTLILVNPAHDKKAANAN